MARSWRGHKPYDQYPVRTCQTMHECHICRGTIHAGEKYHDGGYTRRIHVKCIKKHHSDPQTAPTKPTRPGHTTAKGTEQ